MGFVISEGQVRALSAPRPALVTSVQLTDDHTADYAELYRRQQSVRTVVGFLARNIAGLKIHVFRRVSDTDRERVTDHELARLLDRPGGPGRTRFGTMFEMIADKATYDVAFALKVRTSRGVGALIRVPPAAVRAVDGGLMGPTEFEISTAKGRKVYQREDMLVLDGYSPTGSTLGTSPIESLRQVLAEEYEGGRMRSQSLRNAARVSGYLTRPKGASWSPEARTRFEAGWRSQYTGNGPGAGGTPVLEDGMTFVPAQQTARDLQYVEVRKLSREEVAAAYYVPPPLVGILDHATFSNIKEQHKHLYMDTLGPWFTEIEEQFTAQIAPEFLGVDDLYLEYNVRAKLAGDFGEEAELLQAAVGAPYMTPNEARARQNLPRIEGADNLVVPLNVTAGGQASPQDSVRMRGENSRRLPAGKAGPRGSRSTVADEDRAEIEALFRKFFGRQRSVVLSAIGAGAEWWDGERWDSELSADLYPVLADLVRRKGSAAAAAIGFDGDEFDVPRTEKFLRAMTEKRADWVNEATRGQVEAVLADFDGEEQDEALASVFTVAEEQRSISAGRAISTGVAAFAVREAAHQLAPRATKTWITTSGNSRPDHAAMNGETVPVDEPFSNGMQVPGDPVNGADDVAGCECIVQITVP